jgi:hypothetical protein
LWQLLPQEVLPQEVPPLPARHLRLPQVQEVVLQHLLQQRL